jgi:hypothetical protein
VTGCNCRQGNPEARERGSRTRQRGAEGQEGTSLSWRKKLGVSLFQREMRRRLGSLSIVCSVHMLPPPRTVRTALLLGCFLASGDP